MVMQGIAQGMMPLVSVAVGKGDRKAIRFYFLRSLVLVVGAEVLIVAACLLLPQRFAAILLSTDSPLFTQAVAALRQYALSYLLAGINILLAGFFTALGHGKASCLLSLAGEGLSFVLGLVLLKRITASPAPLPAQEAEPAV